MNQKIIDKLPGWRCQTTYTVIGLDQLNDVGQAITHARREIAGSLAELVLKEPKFFSAQETDGGTLLDINFDCCVLTPEELRAELKKMYVLGQESARRGA